jgi:hypothetical protein
MGKLIASTQATVDGVIDPVAEWVQPDGDHGDRWYGARETCTCSATGEPSGWSSTT